jgi:hypothetical protein
VVIGGDAGNDVLAPPRASSTSEQVEKLAKGVDIVVHSTMHPVMVMSGWLAVLSDFTSQNRGRGAASSRQIFLARLFIVPLPFRTSTKGVAFITWCKRSIPKPRGRSSHCALRRRGTNVKPVAATEGRQR